MERSITLYPPTHHPGNCLGPFVGDVPVGTAQECQEACIEEDLCEWWVYHQVEKFCTLLNGCTIRDETCEDCVFGYKTCSEDALEDNGEV